MNFDSLKEKLNEALSKKEMFICDINLVKKGKYSFLEITVDKVGGIDLDGIVDATNIINPIVDDIDYKESFILDVSSKEHN